MSTKNTICALFMLVTTNAFADVFINFDEPLANYTPLPEGVAQVIDDQFLPIGIQFRDANYPLLGAVGDDNGPGSGTVHLYSNNGSGDSDTLPNIDIFIVDIGNPGNPGYITSFSGLVTDSNTTTFTAYDALDNNLGSVSTVDSSPQTLELTGIGNIVRIEIRTPSNATAIDDLLFGGIDYEPRRLTTEPVPAMSPVSLGILGLAFLMLGFVLLRRRSMR